MKIIDFIQKGKAKPDFQQFIDVVTRKKKPAKVHQVELLIDQEIISAITERYFPVKMIPLTPLTQKEFLRQYVRWWWRMGYDYAMMIDLPGIGLEFPARFRQVLDSAPLSRGMRNWVEEGRGVITCWQEFEAYPWPDPENIDLSPYEYATEVLPEGMKLLVAGSSGVLEVVIENLLGFEGISLLLYDDPELVSAVFDRVGDLVTRFYWRLAQIDGIGGFFQGDDMGFKTSTILSPDTLKRYVFPWHKKISDIAHSNGKTYFLHSCGQLQAIMDDLIDNVEIDAFHSFQEGINSVVDYKIKYGRKVGILGGIDLDRLIRSDENSLRNYIKSVINHCSSDGGFALGSGNSIANYVPVDNYLIMLDEGLKTI